MVLYYALGGGLGHLTRARRVLSALGLEGRAVLLTASRFARDQRVTGGLPVVWVPARLGHDRAAFRSWLGDALAALGPEELIVDSFPAGFNVMHETASVRERHRFVPLPRALDDQFARAASVRRPAVIGPAATAET
jgi:hypothetical protein